MASEATATQEWQQLEVHVGLTGGPSSEQEGATVTVIDTNELAKRNAGFATGGSFATLRLMPSGSLTVIGCVDPRVDPSDVLGLTLGEAAVIRNVGGRVTPATLQNAGDALEGRAGPARATLPRATTTTRFCTTPTAGSQTWPPSRAVGRILRSSGRRPGRQGGHRPARRRPRRRRRRGAVRQHREPRQLPGRVRSRRPGRAARARPGGRRPRRTYDPRCVPGEPPPRPAAGTSTRIATALGRRGRIVAVHVGELDGTLMGAQQPAFDQRGDPVHGGQQFVRVVPAGAGGALASRSWV